MYIWIGLVFAADRITKALASAGLGPGQSVPVIEDFLHLTYVHNTGAVFGLFRDQFYLLAAATVATAALFAGILWWYHFSPDSRLISRPAAGMILGGALGNQVDRLVWGYVVDFIDFRVWPVFNVADIALVMGCILLAIHLWRAGEKSDRHLAVD